LEGLYGEYGNRSVQAFGKRAFTITPPCSLCVSHV
jgi:hypothetical protein